MTLTALFMSICAATTLNCSDVKVEYTDFSDDRLGAATMYTNGNTAIFLDNSLTEKRISVVKKIMIHEISHLVYYHKSLENSEKPTGRHNVEYKKICKKLAIELNESTKLCKTHKH